MPSLGLLLDGSCNPLDAGGAGGLGETPPEPVLSKGLMNLLLVAAARLREEAKQEEGLGDAEAGKEDEHAPPVQQLPLRHCVPLHSPCIRVAFPATGDYAQ